MAIAYATFFSAIGFVLIVGSVAFGMSLLEKGFRFKPEELKEFNLTTWLFVVFIFLTGAMFTSLATYTFDQHFQQQRCSKT